jgi:hypothetical protein
MSFPNPMLNFLQLMAPQHLMAPQQPMAPQQLMAPQQPTASQQLMKPRTEFSSDIQSSNTRVIPPLPIVQEPPRPRLRTTRRNITPKPSTPIQEPVEIVPLKPLAETLSPFSLNNISIDQIILFK